MSTQLKIYFRNAPVPSRMLALVKLLIKAGPLSRRDVFTYLHPSLIVNQSEDTKLSMEAIPESEQFKEVLDAARECGLVTIEGLEKTVNLATNLNDQVINLDHIDEIFPIIMAKLILKPRINSSDNLFSKVCAWILNQPVFGTPQDHDGWKKLMVEQCGDLLNEARLRDDTPWDMIVYWMRYIGLAGRTNSEGMRGFYPDPTLYLSMHIDKLLFSKEVVSAEEFKRRLGSLCPVLDGGSMFLEMRSKGHPDDLLSDGLSLALERLCHRKVMKYWCPEDERHFLRLTNKQNMAYISLI